MLESCRNGIYKRRKKLLKTITWRAIATATTFSVAYMVMDDVSKSATVAAIDTVLKTFFYYFHESCYDKAEKRGWRACTDDIDNSDVDVEENENIENENNNNDNINNDNIEGVQISTI